MSACCSEHPEQPGVLCDKEQPCAGYHASTSASMVWGVQEVPAAPPQAVQRRRGPRVDTTAERARIAVLTQRVQAARRK